MMRMSLLLIAGLAASGVQAETWLRVEQPSASLRANLPTQAMDYGNFIWLPAANAPVALLGPWVQARPNPFDLIVDGQALDPAQRSASDNPWMQANTHAGADFRLLQLYGPPRESDLVELREANVRPVRYLAPFSYIVWATQADLASLASRSGNIRWAGDFLPAQKVPAQSRELGAAPRKAMALIDAASADQVLAGLVSANVELVERTALTSDLTLVELQLAGDNFLSAVSVPGVYTLQAIADGGGPRGEMSNQSIVGGYDATNLISPGYLSWLTPTALSGSGVVVSIVDGGVRTTHSDVAANMVPCTGTEGSCGSSNNSHGSHVAAAVAGTGVSGTRDAANFLRGQGVAPGASLVQQLYSPFLSSGPGSAGSMVANGMLRIYKDAAVSSAKLANNSWGPTGVPQGYDIPTLQVDMIARDADPSTPGNQPVLTVWSVMNGNGDRNTGVCAPSSLGSPDEAKNLFAVGSNGLQSGSGVQMLNIFDVSSNSAHGPACDGRQVPHIVAPGCNTDSITSTNNTSFGLMCGTSMASPVVTGASALYWQRYRSQYAHDPSPALIKAVFTVASKNVTGFRDADSRVMPQRPNRFAGWGRLDLDAVINPGFDIWLADQETVLTASGADWEVQLQADDPSEPVRLMLSWTDAAGPGTGGTTASWTNDLDLNVDAGATRYRGNVFDSTSGDSQSGGSSDLKNNLEGVYLTPAQHAGASFSVQVLAATIAADAINPYTPGTPKQDFALVCYNCRVGGPSDAMFKDGFDAPGVLDGMFQNGFE